MSDKKQVVPPITDFLYRKSSALKVPLSGTFELTPICNFSCRMCYVRKTAEEVAAHRRAALGCDDWLKIGAEAAEAGMLHLLLTGGEPFVFPEFERLYSGLNELGLFIAINSNGSLISGKRLEFLKRLPPRRVNITLYGASDEAYERLCGAKEVFSSVCRNIDALKSAGINVKLNCSLTPYNISDADAIIAFAKERNLPLDISCYMFPPVRRDAGMIGVNERFTPEQAAKARLYCYRRQFGEESYGNYLKKIISGSIPPPGLEEGCVDPVDGKIRCRAGKAAFWVTWDGYLTPCGMMTSPKIDFLGGDFKGGWQQLVRASEKLSLSGVCMKCPNISLCHSCAAMAICETGDASGVPEYLCRMVDALRILAAQELEKL